MSGGCGLALAPPANDKVDLAAPPKHCPGLRLHRDHAARLDGRRVGVADLAEAAVGASDRSLRGQRRLSLDVRHRTEAGRIDEHGNGVRNVPGRYQLWLTISVQVADRDRSRAPRLLRSSGYVVEPFLEPARPLLRSTESVPGLVSFPVATSGLPSPFRSPIATEPKPRSTLGR
jgi:hypothetical protein